jgi:ElaB/YqjD/DUF883 family membrane-anchored ribosome-binding protein
MPKTRRSNRDESDPQAKGLREKAHDLVEQSEDKLENVNTRVREVKAQVMSRGNVLLERLSDQVRVNPLKSVVIAFGVGYIGTRLIRR